MDDDTFADLLNTNPPNVWVDNPWGSPTESQQESSQLPAFPTQNTPPQQYSNTNLQSEWPGMSPKGLGFESPKTPKSLENVEDLTSSFANVNLESSIVASPARVDLEQVQEKPSFQVEHIKNEPTGVFDPMSLIPEDKPEEIQRKAFVRKTVKKKTVKTPEKIAENPLTVGEVVKNEIVVEESPKESIVKEETKEEGKEEPKEEPKEESKPESKEESREEPKEEATVKPEELQVSTQTPTAENSHSPTPEQTPVKSTTPDVKSPTPSSPAGIKKKKPKHLNSWLVKDDVLANPLMEPPKPAGSTPNLPSPTSTPDVDRTDSPIDPLSQIISDGMTKNAPQAVKKSKLRTSMASSILGNSTFGFADPLGASGMPVPAPVPVLPAPAPIVAQESTQQTQQASFANIFATAAGKPIDSPTIIEAKSVETPKETQDVTEKPLPIPAAFKTPVETQPTQAPVAIIPPRQASLPDPIPQGPSYFKISVHSPSRQGGISAHTIYKVTTVTNHPAFRSKMGNTVSRRYRDFLWLHDQLALRCPGMVIPPIPGKHVMGRFEDEFIESRRIGLERMLRRICSRPEFLSGMALQDVKTFLESDRFEVESQVQTVKSSGSGVMTWAKTSALVPEVDPELDALKLDMQILEGQLKQMDKVLEMLAKRGGELVTALGEMTESVKVWAALEENKGLMALSNTLNQLKGAEEKRLKDWTALQATVDEYVRMMGEVEQAFQSRSLAFSKWKLSEQNVGTKRAVMQRTTGSSLSSAGKAIALQQELAEAEGQSTQARKEYDDANSKLKQELSKLNREKIADFTLSLNHMILSMNETRKQMVSIWNSIV